MMGKNGSGKSTFAKVGNFCEKVNGLFYLFVFQFSFIFLVEQESKVGLKHGRFLLDIQNMKLQEGVWYLKEKIYWKWRQRNVH